MGDCDRLVELLAERTIAENTLTIPHPYTLAHAETWIAAHQENFDTGKSLSFAITLEGDLTGAIGLRFEPDHARAEIGYWIGSAYRGRGLASEATREVVRYALRDAGLHRVYASHFARNPASGRVLLKAGLACEGVLRGHALKWGRHEDCVFYGVTKELAC
jgi:RimJ/RimL family protein N-acetyltransferase